MDDFDSMKELPTSEDDDTITALDRDPGNLFFCAGYLRMMACKATGDDRLFLVRASRSLRAYAAEQLAKEVR